MRFLMLAVLFLLLTSMPAQAIGADWTGVGIVSDAVARVSDDGTYVRLDFLLTNDKGVQPFTAWAYGEDLAAQVMFIPAGNKYRVKMDQVGGRWIVRDFTRLGGDDTGTLAHRFKPRVEMPQSVSYDTNATGTGWIMRATFGVVGVPPMEMLSNAAKVLVAETDLVQVDARATSQSQLLFEDWIPLQQISPLDPTRQDPPILQEPYERIDTAGGKQYLVTTTTWFAIHFYSLDDPLTPESELRFITRFSTQPIIGEWWR